MSLIQRIFHMYVDECRGFASIAKKLNSEGISTARTSAWCACYHGGWSVATLRNIIQNPAYVGDLVWNRRTDGRFYRIAQGMAVERRDTTPARRLVANHESDWIVVSEAHEPLISRRVFDSARQVLRSKPASEIQRGVNPRTGVAVDEQHQRHSAAWVGYRAKFLLSGLMTCARCGNRYEGRGNYGGRRPDGSRNRTYVYGCGGYIRQGRRVCELGGVPQLRLEAAITDAVIEFYREYSGSTGRQNVRDALDVHADQSDVDLNERRKDLQLVVKKIDRAVRNLLDNITANNRDMIDQRLIELRQQRGSVEGELAMLAHMSFSREEHEALIDETNVFATGLPVLLRSGLPDARNIALRRCAASIKVDAPACKATMQLRLVPYIGIASQNAATRVAVVTWQ